MINSADIVNLLAAKHSQDVFVTECKTGPSGNGYSRLDAWVMTKSWAHPRSIGYEIKIARRDFLQDNKWPAYLDYCNEFYFVCPDSKIISVNELPEKVGLFYVSSTGSRVWQKKKAVYHELAIPEEFYKYILMSRVKIVPSTMYYSENGGKGAYWKQWFTLKKEDFDRGCFIGKRMREVLKKKVYTVETENTRLQQENKSFAEARALLKAMGIRSEQDIYLIKGDIERLEKKRKQLIPDGLEYEVRNIIEDLNRFRIRLETISRGKTEEKHGGHNAQEKR